METERKSEPSSSAFARLWALQASIEKAAKAMLAGNTYSDFFVEGSGPPWHEAFEDVIDGRKIPTKSASPDRMAFIDRYVLSTRDPTDYPDFFVEGSGPPWHEAFPDVINGDGGDGGDGGGGDGGDGGGDMYRRLTTNPENAFLRVRALGKSNVIQAYQRLRASTHAQG